MAEAGKDGHTWFFSYFELVRASQSYACPFLENTGEGTQTEMSQVAKCQKRTWEKGRSCLHWLIEVCLCPALPAGCLSEWEDNLVGIVGQDSWMYRLVTIYVTVPGKPGDLSNSHLSSPGAHFSKQYFLWVDKKKGEKKAAQFFWCVRHFIRLCASPGCTRLNSDDGQTTQWAGALRPKINFISQSWSLSLELLPKYKEKLRAAAGTHGHICWESRGFSTG